MNIAENCWSCADIYEEIGYALVIAPDVDWKDSLYIPTRQKKLKKEIKNE